MNHGIRTIVIPVKDLATATPIYRTLLGVDPYVEQPYYVGFRIADQEIGLDPNGHQSGLTAPIPYCHVDDVAAALATLRKAGATVRQEVTDVGGGKLIASAVDRDGNVIGLLQEA